MPNSDHCGLTVQACAGVQVFSFDLVDVDRSEIKVTGFNDMCDKFFDRIEEGKVYTISKASVKPKKQGNVRPSPSVAYEPCLQCFSPLAAT